MRLKKFFLYFSIVAFAALAFWGGVFVGIQGDAMLTFAGVRQPHLAIDVSNKATPSKLQHLDFNLFWEVWDLVKQKYVNQPVSDETLYYGALKGLLSALEDPYSVFLTPQLSERFSQDLTGTFGGIGAEIGMRKNQLMIIAPLSGSPAEKTGLKAGDAILEIDKKDTGGISLDDAVTRIRGPKGTQVVLKIFRDAFKKPKDFTITRDTIVVQSVDGYRARLSKKGVLEKNKGSIAYVKLANFNEDTTEKMTALIRDLLLITPKGIILDLRNNPGGYLETSVEVANLWVEKGKLVVKEQLYDQSSKEHSAVKDPLVHNVKTIILTNEGSASASEIVAGSLQDYAKAIVVGRKTFGKGSVQELITMRGGSSVKITIAKWFTPNGRSINDEGVKPDVEITDVMIEKAEKGGYDAYLVKAFELLGQPMPAKKQKSKEVKKQR